MCISLILYLYCCFCLLVASNPPSTPDSVLFLTSAATNLQYISSIQALASTRPSYPVLILDSLALTEESLSTIRPRLIVDFMNNAGVSFALRSGAPIETQWLNGNAYSMPGDTSVFPTDDSEFANLAALAIALNLTKICLFLSTATANGEFRFAGYSVKLDVTTVIVTEELDFESLKLLLRKEVKTKGLVNFVIAMSAEMTIKLLQAMGEISLEKSPITMIWSQSAARVRHFGELPKFAKAGPMFLSEIGCEKSATVSQLIGCKVSAVYFNRFVHDLHSIIMLKNATETVVGSLRNHSVSLCSDCFTFLSQMNSAEARSMLQISFNNGTMNPKNDTNNGEKEWYMGAYLAVMDVNSRSNILPNHYLKVFNVTLGMNLFDFAWVMKQMSTLTRDDFGLAFMHSQYSGVAVPLYDVFAHNLSWALPQIGSAILTPMLSSPVTHPYFSRVVVSTDYFAVLYVNMLKRYKWKRIALLYCDDLFCRDLYGTFKVVAAEAGIEIVNPEESRRFPSNMYEYPTGQVPIYQQIIDSKVKIVFMMLYGTSMFYSLEVFYDLGMRRGDLFFLATTWLVPSVFTTGEEQSIMKRKEMLHGALQFYPVSYYGPVGKDIKKRLRDVFKVAPANKACLYYDAIMSIGYALDYLIERGDQYEAPNVLAKQLKRVRFIGCSGEVSMQDGSNDRSPMIFQILNAVVKYDGSVDIREVGVYDPTGLVLFNFSISITWPDNTTNTPLDTRYNSIDCPFDEKQIVDFVPGAILVYSILLAMSIVSTIITIVIWRKFWRFQAKSLINKAEISFDDYVLFATIAFEGLQYAAMGPQLPSSISLLATLSDSLSWKMENLLNLTNGMFWTVLDGVLACVLIWVVLLVVAKLQLAAYAPFVCSFLGDMSEKALPILGNLCFLPITSMLLNVFQCNQAVENGGTVGFTDTFLRKDCYQVCWVMPHLIYAIVTVIAMIIYVPTAVYLRPTWQDSQPSLHVHTSPSYLMIKTIYQLLLLITRKVVSDFNLLAHALIYINLTALFFGFTWKWRPFGYARANLWHDLSLIGVMWLALLTMLNILISNAPDVLWIFSFLIGIATLVLFGIAYQFFKLPAMLYRPKGVHVVDLFKFQFSRGKKFLYLFNKDHSLAAVEPDNSARQLADPSPRVYPTFSGATSTMKDRK